MAHPLTIGIGWLTDFDRVGWQRLLYRPLRYAYRSPSYFGSTMVGAGHVVRFVRFDEDLRLEDLDGTQDSLTDHVDLLYVSTHGECRKSEYRVALRTTDWLPCGGGFGASGPSVAVFDTCDLISLADPTWSEAWTRTIGRSCRLVLGFASPATVAQSSTKRGRLFAELISSGEPAGPSWLEAVNSTSFPGLDLGVAIGFGESRSDAQWALNRLRLDDIPARRADGAPCVAEVEASR